MARTPTPIVSPSTPTSGASRTSSAASGSFPTSGLSTGATLGPWMIEEQSMEIQYWRVPQGYHKSFEASLTALTYTTVFSNTQLAWIATLNHSKKKSYESFDASSWQQTQLLDVLAVSADVNGTAYGNITASTLGPVGSVITTRPYYRRVAWDDAVDVTSMETGYACNFVLAEGNQVSGYTTGPANEQTSIVGNQEKFAISTGSKAYPFYVNHGSHIMVFPNQAVHWFPGAYTTDQETLYKLIDWIDNVAKVVTGYHNSQEWVGAFSIPATVTTNGKNFLKDAYCASYDVTHHDWS